jgi:hypothetical protein
MERTCERALAMSVPPKGDMCGATRDVCFGPKADIEPFTRSTSLDFFRRSRRVSHPWEAKRGPLASIPRTHCCENLPIAQISHLAANLLALVGGELLRTERMSRRPRCSASLFKLSAAGWGSRSSSRGYCAGRARRQARVSLYPARPSALYLL